MLFSIIIPAYNAANTIGYCLDSVISQDFPKDDYEIIVVDDCSPDNQNDVIQTYITNCPPDSCNSLSMSKISDREEPEIQR